MTDPNLHDATFVEARIAWETRAAAFNFETVFDGSVRLEVSGVANLSLPHQEPWGPSASVNEFRRLPDGFEIEMQSGDVIAVTASGASFGPLPKSGT
jgi:hypothetical protein